MSDFDAAMKGHQILMDGLKSFNEGLTKFAARRATNQAQEELNALSSSEMEESQKRQKQQLIAQNLVMNLSKAGADPTIANSIAPRPLNQTDEGIMMARNDQLSENKASRDFTASQNKLSRDNALEIAGLRAVAGQSKLKPLTDKHVDKLTSLEDDSVLGTRLMEDVAKRSWLVGPAAGRIPGRGIVDPDYAGFQQQIQGWFDSYRSTITGAGASDQELQRLEANRPTVKDSPSQFKAKVQAILKVGKERRINFIKTAEKSGRDVRKFLPEIEGTEQSTTQEAPAAATSAPQTPNFSKYLK